MVPLAGIESSTIALKMKVALTALEALCGAADSQSGVRQKFINLLGLSIRLTHPYVFGI